MKERRIMKKNNLKVRGFTIVETSLVLAIGGLILAMVFIALPSLQRSQRDTQRKADIEHLISEIKNYQTNNNGTLPKLNDATGSASTIKLAAERITRPIDNSNRPIIDNSEQRVDIDQRISPTPAEGELASVLVEGPVTDGSVSDVTWAGFYKVYLGDRFIDPAGGYYNLYVTSCGETSLSVDAECTTTMTGGQANVSDTDFPNNYQISVITGATCEGTKAIKVANPRMIAALYRLEGSGEFCAHT